jgi:hypothetical protein
MRRAVSLPARFRLLREGQDLVEMRLTNVIPGKVRDIGMHGLGMEIFRPVIDGLRIDQITTWKIKARLFLQWQMVGGEEHGAVAEPVWCEPTGSAEAGPFHLGIRFRELPLPTRNAIQELLEQR